MSVQYNLNIENVSSVWGIAAGAGADEEELVQEKKRCQVGCMGSFYPRKHTEKQKEM